MAHRIMMVGDVHGDWGKLNTVISAKHPETIIQCGDFGYWPRWNGKDVDVNTHEFLAYNRKPRYWKFMGIKNGDVRVHWCDGNHEDHASLRRVSEDMDQIETMPNVFYQRRGSVLTLPDHRTVLFMGGADSIDKNYRTAYEDWFPEELITSEDMRKLPDHQVDIVVSHTAPREFKLEMGKEYEDPSRSYLSVILDKYRPNLWYFSHFHVQRAGYEKGCKWFCLNKASDTGWWEWLR